MLPGIDHEDTVAPGRQPFDRLELTQKLLAMLLRRLGS